MRSETVKNTYFPPLSPKEIVLNYEQRLSFRGEEVTIKAKPSKNIYWCSHWELIDDLFKAGAIHRTFSRCDGISHWEYQIKL